MSFIYAKLLVVVCITYVISEVVTHKLPLYYYEGFFTYLYGMSILFLLYVFCFLLQESACCARGSDTPPPPPRPPKTGWTSKEAKDKNKKKDKKDKDQKQPKSKKETQVFLKIFAFLKILATNEPDQPTQLTISINDQYYIFRLFKISLHPIISDLSCIIYLIFFV